MIFRTFNCSSRASYFKIKLDIDPFSFFFVSLFVCLLTNFFFFFGNRCFLTNQIFGHGNFLFRRTNLNWISQSVTMSDIFN